MIKETTSLIKSKKKNYLKNIIKRIVPTRLLKLAGFYRDKYRIAKSFRINNQYMLPGKYHFNDTFHYIYLDNKDIAQKASKKLDNGYAILASETTSVKGKIKLILCKIFNIKLKIRKNLICNDFQGTIFSPGGINNNIKIFDLHNKKVLWKFSNKDGYEKRYLHTNISNPSFQCQK